MIYLCYIFKNAVEAVSQLPSFKSETDGSPMTQNFPLLTYLPIFTFYG